MATKKIKLSETNATIIQEPSKKVVVKSAKSQSDIENIKRLRDLTSKAMGFPKERRMADGSPLPHGISKYQQHYDAIHIDGDGNRIATSIPPLGLLKNDKNERIKNKHLTEEEQDELESLCSEEEELPNDWHNKSDKNGDADISLSGKGVGRNKK